MPSHDKNVRARFKKGQKVCHSVVEIDDNGEEIIKFYPVVITRGEKRRDPTTDEAVFYYGIQYIGYDDSHDTEVTEQELYKYDLDLVEGNLTAVADEARQQAWELYEEKKRQQRFVEIPDQLRLHVMPQLKQITITDYENIIEQGRILPLPRSKYGKPSVTELIRDWQVFRKHDEEESLCVKIDQICESLLSYFDFALRQCLLYHFEVPMCDIALADGNSAPRDVYGGEHLVRLLIKLPELVSIPVMTAGDDARNVVTVEEEVEDLMAWLAEETRMPNLFSSKDDYVVNIDWTPPLQVLQSAQRNTKAAGDGGHVQNDDANNTALEQPVKMDMNEDE